MIVTALVLAGPLAAGAQGHPYAPLILQLPGSTRALAMGNANVGGRDDDVLFYNPAQLFVARGTSVSEQWYSGADMLTTISTSGLTLGPGIIGLGVQSLAFRSDLGTPDPSQLGRSRFFPASGLVLATGYSQRLFGTRLGVVAKLVDQQIGTLRDRRGAYDAGIARDMLRGTFGLSVQNIGEAMRTGPTPLVPLGITSERVPMPTRATFGYQMSGLPVGQFDIAASSAVSVSRGHRVSGGVGSEIGYSWLEGYSISIRGGARRAADAGEGRWTAGFAANADRLSLEYALEGRQPVTLPGPGALRPVQHRTAHRIGLRIR
jgi:hypothetical protein